jgi:hypothetical protein
LLGLFSNLDHVVVSEGFIGVPQGQHADVQGIFTEQRMRLDEERLTAELTGPIDRTIPGVQTRGEGLGPHGGNDVPGGSVREENRRVFE